MLNKSNVALRQKLTEQSCLGIFSKTTDSAFVEAAGLAGLDFIILDTEHGPSSWETIQHNVRAAKLTEMAPIVRVRGLDAHAIGAALDAGAEGVQVPNISTAEQAAAAVEAARFSPLGRRGVCRFVRAAEFGRKEKTDYFASENKKLLILQVEGLEGVKNIEAILAVDGFDVLFIGPYDLSQSIGKPGEVESAQVLDSIREVSARTLKSGKFFGIFCDTPSAATVYRNAGATYLAYSVDLSLYRERIADLVKSI